MTLVQRIVRSNPKLLRNHDFEDKSNTSLHLAAAQGFGEIVQHLIAAGHEEQEISVNTDNDTPLMLAAARGHVAVGTLLVQEYPRCIPFQNKRGLDALAIASQNPASTTLIQVLLSNPSFPADPESRDYDGNTALHHASASSSLKALRVLLAAGANPLAKNNCDWTPLAYSQTVAAEVYFKNLVAEFERRKVEGARLGEEREKQRAAGVRIIDDSASGKSKPSLDEDEMMGDALKRHWSPTERRQPPTPGSASRHVWGLGLQHIRTRSGSGGA